MSVETAELTLPAVRLPESALTHPNWLDVASDWYEIATPDVLADESLPKFSYDWEHDEYAIDVAHPQARRLSRMVLQGAVDHDKVLDSELDSLMYEGAIDADDWAAIAQRRRVGGTLIGLVDGAVLAEESVAGVLATNPRSLFDALDAFTRLPQLSISDRELAHASRREYIDWLHGLALQAAL